MSLSLARPMVAATVSDFDTPPVTWRDAATKGSASRVRHDALLAESGTFNAVRLSNGVDAELPALPLTVGSWNLERCKNVEGTAQCLRETNAKICLLTEMDIGMARSGNRDTVADLAGFLGMNHAFGIEFIELGIGDAHEQQIHKDEQNQAALHGNAILSTLPIERVTILPLDEGGDWFNDAEGNDQRRIGGRMAIAARFCLPEPIWCVAAHYESRFGAVDRALETEHLLDQLDRLTGDDPVLIGGDFNCRGITEGGLHGAEVLERPADKEPLFRLFADAGFDWQACNTEGTTTRHHPWTPGNSVPKKIDWFFTRGLTCSGPAIIEAVDKAGTNLSDHELIRTTVEGIRV